MGRLLGFKILVVMSLNPTAMGVTFQEAVSQISRHNRGAAAVAETKAIISEGESKTSWDDPQIRLMGKNIPASSYATDDSPMTGTEISISQKFPVSGKYGDLEKAYQNKSESAAWHSRRIEQELLRNFWVYLISVKKLGKQKKILKDNLLWIDKILKTSRVLYSHGKLNQTALLEFQIRRSRLQTALNNIQIERQKLEKSYGYIVGLPPLDHSTIPWHVIEEKDSQTSDYQEKNLASKLRFQENFLSYQQKSRIPDLTVSLGYTKRNDIDGLGDFISAGFSIPIPVSNKRRANVAGAMQSKLASEMRLEDYKKEKQMKLQSIALDIKRAGDELGVLDEDTIVFAKTARDITAKAYGIGKSSYIELLQSEIKLQELMLRKINLDAELSKKKIDYKFVAGGKLHE